MNSGRLLSMIATVSPLPTPSAASPPEIRFTFAARSFQLQETLSSSVRIATSSPSRSVVARKAW